MSNYTLIKCGKLFDGIKEELQENVEIVVKDNKIEEVGKNLSVPNNVNVIDLSSVTVTPGLMSIFSTSIGRSGAMRSYFTTRHGRRWLFFITRARACTAALPR